MRFQNDAMIPHPEGGRYREIFRSPSPVTTTQGAERTALTHIYFSLKTGERSRFHRVASDEVWNLYRGALRLHLWDEAEETIHTIELSERSGIYCFVVHSGVWQAAEPLTEEALVGCSVAPGFEFDDFTLIDPRSETAQRILEHQPTMAPFIVPAGGLP